MNINAGLIPPEIAIYGSGSFGARLAKTFELAGSRVIGFSDRNRQAPPGYATLGISQLIETDAPVAIGIHNPGVDLQPIISHLREAGIKEILNPVQAAIRLERSGCSFDNYWLTGKVDLYLESTEDQRSARDGLHDERSRQLFDQIIAYRSKGIVEQLAHPDQPDEQYLPLDVPFVGTNMRYVDIGGFDGDTVRALRAIPGALSAIVSFEPDPANYDKLWKEISSLSLVESMALPLALSNELEILSFDANSDSSASISSAGEFKVQSASFDTLLPNWGPTHIKMDVEGAEPEVIAGMLTSLQRYRPSLAISVYHAPQHHWAIQQSIQMLDLGYRFYLRSYAYQTFETVLYCIPEETVPV